MRGKMVGSYPGMNPSALIGSYNGGLQSYDGGKGVLLDGISNIAAVFSLRKLSSSYSGSCIRIRRNQDDVETNINFNAYGIVDVQAINNFLAASSPASTTAFVVTWYDQSGNALDATQTTAANQATFNATTAGGKPGMVLDGTNDSFQLPSGLYTLPSGNNTIMAVSKLGAEAGRIEALINFREVGVENKCYLLYNPTAGQVDYRSNNGTAGAASSGNTNTDLNIITAQRNGVNCSVTVNNDNEGTSTDGADSTGIDDANIGTIAGVLANITLAELILFDAAISSGSVSSIQANQSSYFGITLA